MINCVGQLKIVESFGCVALPNRLDHDLLRLILYIHFKEQILPGNVSNS